ncbi:hypothetical protein [Insolitispirillum peregrinum]|uniref:hypothetical protein n=1 Tax=Insolitispirillum peregrinum TaxID=80876 RepID=UPI003606FDB3
MLNTEVITEGRFVEIVEALGDSVSFRDVGATRVYQGLHKELGNVVITHNPFDDQMLLVSVA